MVTEEQVLASTRCSIVAPAGCGKTQLIVNCTNSSPDGSRFLILTHTHAGVRALRSRFRRLGVDKNKFTIETIAGWSLGYARAYPKNSGLGTAMPAGADWNDVYVGMTTLLAQPSIHKVLQESYSGVFVDEYQDCTRLQHSLICALAEIIPCRVFGDPLQGIFGFAGGSIPWVTEIEAFFPSLGTLDYPWRWHEKNIELGQWLIDIRPLLIAGEPIDLRTAPMNWVQDTPENQRNSALRLLNHEQEVVVIRKMPNQAHEFARGIGRAYVSMVEVECKDLMTFARDMDANEGMQRAVGILEFAKKCISGLPTANLLENFQAGRLPTVRLIKDEQKRLLAEVLILATQSKDHEHVKKALTLIEGFPDTRIFRRELWQEAQKVFASYIPADENSIYKTAWSIRNKSRFLDRNHGRYVVSRTLLIKGLEFDHALIPTVDELTGGDAAKHFYVAASRGARSLTALSGNPILRFPPPVL